MGLPPSTSVASQDDLLNSSQSNSSERVVEYNFFFSDLNEDGTPASDKYVSTSGVDPFEGYQNDDSYRSSRGYALKPGLDDTAKRLLRENSLARQLSEKKDQPATIRLIRRRSQEELVLNPGEKKLPWDSLIPPNTKFFLEQVSESREEKVQILDTFGEWVAFFFGRKPEIYSYSGTLLNARNHDWKNEFQFNYDNFLRGSQAVKNKATMILQYDDVIVEGYMLNCAISQSANADKSVPFSFTLLVINRSSANPTSLLGFRGVRSGLSELEMQIYNTLSEAINNLEKEGGVQQAETFFLVREYFSGNAKPPAGTTTFENGIATSESESIQPGAASGISKESRSSSTLSISRFNEVKDLLND